jgi:hypothetical protein
MNETTTPFPILLLILLFPIGFALIWGFVCYLLAWIGGWQQMARHYRSERVPNGQAVGGFWAMLGPVSHRGTLTLQAAPEGLYLSMMILFRLGHPTLLIPWHAIKRRENAPGSLFTWLALDLGSPKITTLRLPAGSVDEKVLAQYINEPSRFHRAR